jgi:O-antigen biosynthesis protein WbqP
VGYNNKIFNIYKFRTLATTAPHDLATNQFIDLKKYLTKTGKFLRNTSMDELPQLINILFGKMSFIGPRPLLWNQYDLINKRQADKSNLIKPGITGLAQISKIAEDNDDEKTKLDRVYYDKYSLKQDLLILFKTIFTFL